MEKILFASSEVFPFVKTGGLGDVASSLPKALKGQRLDVRVILPHYGSITSLPNDLKILGQWQDSLFGESIRVSEGKLPQSSVKAWFVQHPIYHPLGGPYTDAQGDPWPDSAKRFALFCAVIADIARGQTPLSWQPDVVHLNDWQTALAAPLLRDTNVATVFTIHNLAYQGLFTREQMQPLPIPDWMWGFDAMEFYDQFSFIKGGLVYADMITTVSPNYAREIQTEDFGCGLHHLLHQRRENLVGILNGIDHLHWDPRHDPLIFHPYGLKNLNEKAVNKQALQEKSGLPTLADVPLFGHVGRLAQQKGLDLLLELLPQWLQGAVQLVILGTGDKVIEKELKKFEDAFSGKFKFYAEYDEPLAHQIEAGSDIFLMPSRFEPCGLNQLYSLRYGTIPIVHGVGGLADTVVDFQKGERATGFVFKQPSASALGRAMDQATICHQDRKRWRQMMQTAMKQDFSWKTSAKQYLTVYRRALAQKRPG